MSSLGNYQKYLLINKCINYYSFLLCICVCVCFDLFPGVTYSAFDQNDVEILIESPSVCETGSFSFLLYFLDKF